MILVTMGKIARIPYIETFLGEEVTLKRHTKLKYFAGWGAKKSGLNAAKLASKYKISALFLEDGFLRSYGTGAQFPPLSIIVDNRGIYYDSTRPSALEDSLNEDKKIDVSQEVLNAKSLILKHQLSKYNHAPLLTSLPKPANNKDHYQEKVLVIDQTFGDKSVALGHADENTFRRMLQSAYDENPKAVIYVKTHPEVSSGRKNGYLSHLQSNDRTIVLRDPINPLSLIAQMDKIYVVTSTMGFEALLVNKPVSVFGIPWYAGWGVTDDRLTCKRRTKKRTVDELFFAAYMQYTRYLNPTTKKLGTIFDVIDWLIHQKRVSSHIFNVID